LADALDAQRALVAKYEQERAMYLMEQDRLTKLTQQQGDELEDLTKQSKWQAAQLRESQQDVDQLRAVEKSRALAAPRSPRSAPQRRLSLKDEMAEQSIRPIPVVAEEEGEELSLSKARRQFFARVVLAHKLRAGLSLKEDADLGKRTNADLFMVCDGHDWQDLWDLSCEHNICFEQYEAWIAVQLGIAPKIVPPREPRPPEHRESTSSSPDPREPRPREPRDLRAASKPRKSRFWCCFTRPIEDGKYVPMDERA
jgi:hypothetical protein